MTAMARQFHFSAPLKAHAGCPAERRPAVISRGRFFKSGGVTGGVKAVL